VADPAFLASQREAFGTTEACRQGTLGWIGASTACRQGSFEEIDCWRLAGKAAF
jgi:hypothetical protein